jgi:hypothetical protein
VNRLAAIVGGAFVAMFGAWLILWSPGVLTILVGLLAVVGGGTWVVRGVLGRTET